MNRNKYYPFIDGMRAIAVIAVVIFHIKNNLLPGGYLGVDLFFVVSGFVVTASVNNFEGTFFNLLQTFYARRFKRILPALLFLVILGSLAVALFLPVVGVSSANQRVGKGALYGMSNWRLIDTQKGYFSPSAELNLFTHTWSLGVEEQFYVLFPFLIFLWLKAGSRRTWATAFLFLLTVLSLSVDIAQSHESSAFFSTYCRFWEIAVGVLLYFFTKSRFAKALARPQMAPLFGGLLLFSIFLQFVSPTHLEMRALDPILPNLIVVLSTGLFLVFFEAAPPNFLNSFLTTRPLVYLGRISFSLYLFHWLVIAFMRWTCGVELPEQKALALIASFALACLSYHYVEMPARHLRFWLPSWGLPTNLKIIVLGILAIELGLQATQLIFDQRARITFISSVNAPAMWDPELTPIDDVGCALEESRSEYQTHWALAKKCSPPSPHPHLFVIGDSHAQSYTGMLKKLSHEDGFTVDLYTAFGSGCGLLTLMRADQNPSETCLNMRKSAYKDILKNACRGDILFLPALRLIRFGDQWEIPLGPEADSAMLKPEIAQARQELTASAPEDLAEFVKLGLKIVVELPKPIFRYPAFRCWDWFNRSNPVCKFGPTMDRQELLSYRQPIVDSILAIKKNVPQLYAWDPFPILCPETPTGVCSSAKDNLPLFFDGDHLSGYGNIVSYPDFAKFLAQLGANHL